MTNTAVGETLISWKNVYKAFGPKRIFEGLDLEVRRGETLTIIGGSGTGKSVMLKCLIGLIYPDRGNILFEGGDVTTYGEKEIREVRKRVAMVFQGAALFDSLTVGENIAYPLREHLKELSEAQIAERVAKNLKMVNLPGIELMRPSDLSGGMRKRVGLARAIAIEPEVILYDEPTTGLDPISTRVIDELIISMKKQLGCTSIVVTHDMDSAFRVSDRMAMLSKRKIVASGTVKEMQASTNPDVRAFFDARKS
ncbi:MAG: ABC transporter ATP-binding protein [Archangium sp.]|nr:ABC transporter ATP-binding protein [Archangium sp.]MDP3155472.1 ABC transporter ATP-binding protein [Archangium sp.]MDP3573804.1 ABC transporter ATP-binding protein [Archangium sp.]